jgi:hypothetical protein
LLTAYTTCFMHSDKSSSSANLQAII